MRQEATAPFGMLEVEGGYPMQVTLQLRPKDAALLTQLAISERRTPRRQALRIITEALAQRSEQVTTTPQPKEAVEA